MSTNLQSDAVSAPRGAIIYPLISRKTWIRLVATVGMMIALLVLFLPSNIQSCRTACGLLIWIYSYALQLGEINSMASVSALPVPMAVGCFMAVMLGSVFGLFACFTEADIAALGRSVGRFTMTRRVMFFFLACFFYTSFFVGTPARPSVNHPWTELWEALRTSRVWLILFSDGLFGLYCVLSFWIVLEITNLFGMRK